MYPYEIDPFASGRPFRGGGEGLFPALGRRTADGRSPPQRRGTETRQPVSGVARFGGQAARLRIEEGREDPLFAGGAGRVARSGQSQEGGGVAGRGRTGGRPAGNEDGVLRRIPETR